MKINLNKYNICENLDDEWGWFVDTETLLTLEVVQVNKKYINKLEIITEENEYDNDIEKTNWLIINIMYLCKKIIICISIYLLLIICY
jgi:hypothetical protein